MESSILGKRSTCISERTSSNKALFILFFVVTWMMYDLADYKNKKEWVRKIKKPPPLSQMKECKALVCFLASCCCRCNGASATWDIPHDIYPGDGIDRCFKAALWHCQERPLVTLDKAGDYHINLRAALPCWTSQCMPAPQACRLTAHSTLTRREKNKQLDKMLIATCIHSCVYTDRLAVTVPLMCASGFSLYGLDEVYKLDYACFPCRVYTVLYSTAAPFVSDLICH